MNTDIVAKDGASAALIRIGAMVRRHWYLVAGSWPRIFDLVYWPTVQILLWGFIQTYLQDQQGAATRILGALLGAAMLWDVFFRSQVSLSVAFLEEIWSRNLGHLMVSPLRAPELLAALVVISLIRTLIGLLTAAIVALLLFGFEITSIGLALVPFFFCLALFGWSLGMMVAGIVLRFGMGAEMLTWVLVAGFAPLCAVYYPVSALPEWIRWAAGLLPPAYVFEGMRAVLTHRVFRPDLLGRAFGLDLLYGLGASGLFLFFLRAARRRGTLIQLGE
jgi:ABC-2 type transport system permease protein